MNWIILKGHDGFEAYLMPERVTAFGRDQGPRLWIQCDGASYSTTVNVEEQFEEVKRLVILANTEGFVVPRIGECESD